MESGNLAKPRPGVPIKGRSQAKASTQITQQARSPQKNPAAPGGRAAPSSKVSTTRAATEDPKRKFSTVTPTGADEHQTTKKPRTVSSKQSDTREQAARELPASKSDQRGQLSSQKTGNRKSTVESLLALAVPDETFAIPSHVLDSKSAASDQLKIMKPLATVLSKDTKYKDDFKGSKFLEHLNRYINALEGLVYLRDYVTETSPSSTVEGTAPSTIQEEAVSAIDSFFESIEVGIVVAKADQGDPSRAGQDGRADAEAREASTAESSAPVNIQEVQKLVEARPDAQFIASVNLDSLKDVREKKRLLSIVSQRLSADPLHLDKEAGRASRFLNTVNDEYTFLDMAEQHHEKAREAEVFGGSLYVKTESSSVGAAPHGDDVGQGALHDVIQKIWNVEDIPRLTAIKQRANDALSGYEGVLDKLERWRNEKERLQSMKRPVKRNIERHDDRGCALRVHCAAMVSLGQLVDAKIDDIRQRT